MKIRHALVTVLAAIVAMSSVLGAADISIEEHIKEIVGKMPAAKPADVYANAAALVKVGPVGVETICRMLVKPGAGDNTKAEYALDALAVYVYRPGAEAERQMFVKAVAGQIDGADGKVVKAFLIKRLEVTGKEESVGAIAKYLSDERLCEPASQALQAIATDNARAALAKALAGAKGNNLVTIISALGNTRCKAAAKDLLKRVFEITDRKWRGIGEIPRSGYRLNDAFSRFDAEKVFDVGGIEAQESPLCIAGQVLQGLRKPHECEAFGKECTPEHPLGAPMVSSEGACAAYYHFGRVGT